MDEPQIMNWKVVWEADEQAPVVRDVEGNPIATIHPASDEKMLARAGLIAAAPGLFDALTGALEVFRVMAEQAEEPASLAAQDMIPVLESALAAANFLAPISGDSLRGP
ncbi:MAG: hypothetical protein WC383_09630 [Gammaproteobacteria bacterium]